MGAHKANFLLAAGALALAAGCSEDPGTGSEQSAMAETHASDTSVEQAVLDWRERRVARLTEPYGYLSLVELFLLEPGDMVVIPE